VNVAIPGAEPLVLDHLVLDMNGTITHRGRLLRGVTQRLGALQRVMSIVLLTADTFGTAEEISHTLGLPLTRVATGADKAAFVTAVGAGRTVAIGNGRNDELMLRAARLGIAVIGHEGASSGSVNAAAIVCVSIVDALDLLLEPRLLVASLRA